MKDVTKNGWKKFGYFWLSWVPVLLYGAISIGVSMIGAVVIGVISVFSHRGDGDIYGTIMNGITENAMTLSVVYAIIGIIATGLWYYFGCKRKHLKMPQGVLSPKFIVFLVGLAFSMQYVINYFMTGIGMVLPQALERYKNLMELAGLDTITVATILYGVILGPIAEELTFRGLTLYFTEKCTKHFWLANILQALAFGIFHMNFIQGAYAFLLGLIMGWIYRKSGSLYGTILFHICFNFLGFTMEYIDALLPQNMIFQIVWGILMCTLTVIILLQITRMEFMNRYICNDEIDKEIERIRAIENMNRYAEKIETEESIATGSMAEQRGNIEKETEESIATGSMAEQREHTENQE